MRTTLALLLAAALAVADTSRRDARFNPAGVGLMRSLPCKSPGLYGLAVSPDGRILAVAGADGNVRLLNTTTWKEERIAIKLPEFAWAVAFSPDGATLAAAGSDGPIRLIDTKTWAERAKLDGHAGYVYGLAWSPDGKRLASASADQTARIWDPAAGREVKSLGGHTNYVGGIAWSPDGRKLATASYDFSVRTWDVASGLEERSTAIEGVGLLSVAFTRDGKRLLVGGVDGSVHLVDGNRVAWTQRPHDGGVYALAVSPDHKFVLSAGGKTLQVHELETGKPAAALKHHHQDIYGMAVGPGARWIATAAQDYQVKIWGPVPGGMARIRGKGFFGVSIQTQGGGATVQQVIKDTAAERAGMQVGDVLKKIGGQSVETTEEAIGVIGSFFDGDEIEIVIDRGGTEMTLKVKLGPRPENLDR